MNSLVLVTADRIVRIAELEQLDAPHSILEKLKDKVKRSSINEEELGIALKDNIKNRIDVALSYNDLCGNLLNCPYLFDRCWGPECNHLIPGEFTDHRLNEIVAYYLSIIEKVGKKYRVDVNHLKDYLYERSDFVRRTVFSRKPKV